MTLVPEHELSTVMGSPYCSGKSIGQHGFHGIITAGRGTGMSQYEPGHGMEASPGGLDPFTCQWYLVVGKRTVLLTAGDGSYHKVASTFKHGLAML